MLKSIKRLTKHSMVYGVGSTFSRFFAFLLMPIHTNVFSPEEYRIPTLLFASLPILNLIFSYGLDSAFLQFFITEDSKKEKQRIFSTTFLMILGTGLFFSAILIFYPGPFSKIIFQSTEHGSLIQLAGGIVLIDSLCLFPFLVLRAEEKSTRFIILKSLNVIVSLFLNIVFVVILRQGVESIFVANLITSAFTLLLVMPIILHWFRPAFHRTILVELLQFGLPTIASGIAVLIIDRIGTFFTDRMVGTEATSLFSVGVKLGTFMALIVAGFRFAWQPFFLETSKQEKAPQIFARVLTYFIMVTGFLFLIISYFIKEIVGFHISGFGLIGKDYISSVQIVPLIMLAYIASGIYANFIVGIYLKRKTIYFPFVTILGAIVSIILNRFLTPHWGISGAAWAMFFSYAVMTLALFAVNQHLYPIPYEYSRLLKLFCIFTFLFILGRLNVGQWSIAYRIGLLTILFPLLEIMQFFNSEEHAAVKKVFRRLFG